MPNIPGIDGDNVVDVMKVYGGEEALGQRVVVMGGACTGVETGMHLARDFDRDVVVLGRNAEICKDAPPTHYMSVLTSDIYHGFGTRRLLWRISDLGVLMSSSTKVIILGGFLGSGKTTLLLELGKYITAHSEKETPLAILENEIGEVDVDGAAVGQGGYAVKSLFAGCACCELLGALPDAVRGILDDFNPEVLIVEATGVAVPASMAQAISKICPQVKVAVLADASRWKRIRLPLRQLLTSQLESAQIVLINKCDLADQETIEMVKEDVVSYSGVRPVVCMSAQQGLSEEDVQAILG